MLASIKSCLTCGGSQKDDNTASADMGNNKSKPAQNSPANQPEQHSAPATSSPAGTASDAHPQSSQIEEQKNRQQADPATEGPAAAQGKAQRALQATKEQPQTSTDPDAGDWL